MVLLQLTGNSRRIRSGPKGAWSTKVTLDGIDSGSSSNVGNATQPSFFARFLAAGVQFGVREGSISLCSLFLIIRIARSVGSVGSSAISMGVGWSGAWRDALDCGPGPVTGRSLRGLKTK